MMENIPFEDEMDAVLGSLETAKATGERLTALLDELRALRAQQARSKPLLKPGESWKEFARDGLD